MAVVAATMVGGELGILCFFESQLREQCSFLWVSPLLPSASPVALLPCSSFFRPIVGDVGRGLGGVPGKHGPTGLAPPLPQDMTTGWRLPLWPQFPHLGGNGAHL